LQVNPLTREVLVKLVYYGPGLGGKTTSLQRVHQSAPAETRGQIVSLATPVDRTLYFDFLPLRLPPVRGHHVRLQLFTVPGQVYFNATRKLVLTGADGVVFVADSQRVRQDANIESMENLMANLGEQGRTLADVPYVFQYNKRDLADLLTIEELEGTLNESGAPAYTTCATSGEGVLEALDALVQAVLTHIETRQSLGAARSEDPRPPLELSRAEEALEDRIGRASEQLWQGTVDRALAGRETAPDGTPVPAARPATGAPAATPAAMAPIAKRASPTTPAAPPAGPSVLPTATGPSWASLFEKNAEQVRELERSLVAGRLTDAVQRCDQLALRTLAEAAAAAGLAAGAAPALVALLLGVEGERWMTFRRTVRRIRDGGPVSETDALGCFALLIELRTRCAALTGT
jgi:signal recognition particle receptor subunit beta